MLPLLRLLDVNYSRYYFNQYSFVSHQCKSINLQNQQSSWTSPCSSTICGSSTPSSNSYTSTSAHPQNGEMSLRRSASCPYSEVSTLTSTSNVQKTFRSILGTWSSSSCICRTMTSMKRGPIISRTSNRSKSWCFLVLSSVNRWLRF